MQYQDRAVAQGYELRKIELIDRYKMAVGADGMHLITRGDILQGVFTSPNGNATYKTTIDLTAQASAVTHRCDCIGATERAKYPTRLCTHASVLVTLADDPSVNEEPDFSPARTSKRAAKLDKSAPTTAAPAQSSKAADAEREFKALYVPVKLPYRSNFHNKVLAAIMEATEETAVQVAKALLAKQWPFLLGYPGCGKTFSLYRASEILQASLFRHDGGETVADADLYGMRLSTGESPGVIAKLCKVARGGQKVMAIFDEMLRNPARAQNGLMGFSVPIPENIAARMPELDGYTGGQVLYGNAPIWGSEWAPLDNVFLTFAANPQTVDTSAAEIDPAFSRRVKFIEVDYNYAVLALLDQKIAEVIRALWDACKVGAIKTPIDYKAILDMESPDDTSVVTNYILRSRYADPAGMALASAIWEA